MARWKCTPFDRKNRLERFRGEVRPPLASCSYFNLTQFSYSITNKSYILDDILDSPPGSTVSVAEVQLQRITLECYRYVSCEFERLSG